MSDRVLKRFRIVDPSIRANCAKYVSTLNPRLHKGELHVVIYEHVATVTKDQRGAYMANLGELANRYRNIIARVADKTGHTPEEICIALHHKSQGRLFDHQPSQGDFHELMKDRYNGGASTTEMTKAAFSKYMDNALREAKNMCDILDQWSKRHFQ